MPAIEVDELLEFLQEKKRKSDLDEAIANRKVTAAEIRAALAEASDEDKAELRRFLGYVEDKETKPETESVTEPTPKPKATKKKPKETAPVRTRPGRKSGAAYDWDVDEDGQVVGLSIAKVYSGPDEEDEVEIPEQKDPETSETDTGEDDDTDEE